jgi:hypothetical protein
MEEYPELQGDGYVVTEERPDFRITISQISLQGKASPKLQKAFKTMFKNADEYESTETCLRAWYD